MLRVTENKDEIVLRDIPLIQWILSIVIGFLLLLSIFAESSSNKKTLLDWIVVLSIALPILAVLFYLLTIPATTTTTKISKNDDIISIRKRSLIKYTFNIYSFNDLINPIFVKEFNIGRNHCYQLILPLKDNLQIELSLSANLYKEPLQKTANSLNSYLFDNSQQIQ